MILHLRAKPNARANQFLVAPSGSATVRLKAPPQEGQAITAICAYLAGVFSTSKSRMELLRSYTSPSKKVASLDVDEARPAAVLARHQAG